MTDIETWSNEISTSSKLSTNNEFKTFLNPEKYLQVINNYFIRKQLTRFRISNHQLLIEESRHRELILLTGCANFVTWIVSKMKFIFYWCVHCSIICGSSTNWYQSVLVFINHITILSKLCNLKRKSDTKYCIICLQSFPVTYQK